ncbi:MAG: S-layer homology domain-containing protein [Oscillospiraceae bacterium]|jgi:hypothetical protein|nr:S-layer homology domain-containing protein [Oscillospiraceae bacterium]
MKKIFSILLSAALLSGLLATGVSAATLQSNQAVYQLSQDPLGTEPFSYSATETHSVTLVPVGTAIQSEGDGLLLVEVFLYQQAEKHWSLDSMLSGQSQLTIRDGDHIYHISTMDPSGTEPNTALDRGIWVKGQSTGEVQPVTITGEPVDDWAANLVNEAIAKNLFPTHLKGQDLRDSITRTQFAALSVRLYETMSGHTVPAFTGPNPFTDTTDPEVLKAYSMGFTSGVSNTTFGSGIQLNREQAATMLSAVYRKLGGTISPKETVSFSDRSSISTWARDSVHFAASKGVISGYEDGRFGPKDPAQRQACLIMALRMQQKLGINTII